MRFPPSPPDWQLYTWIRKGSEPNKKMKINIAVVQFEINQYRPEENLKKARRFVQLASEKKADVVVFPEDFITGPVAGEKNYVDFEEKYKKVFQTLAKQHSIDIVAGSFIEGEKDG